jgi:hypothetical protein
VAGTAVLVSVAQMERSAMRDSRIPQNSGVPEFCQFQLRKSETCDLHRYRVYPISAHERAQVGNIGLAWLLAGYTL